jgi:hypothetical protein
VARTVTCIEIAPVYCRPAADRQCSNVLVKALGGGWSNALLPQ